MTNRKKPPGTLKDQKPAETVAPPKAVPSDSVSPAKSRVKATPKLAAMHTNTLDAGVTVAKSSQPKPKLLRDSFTIPKTEYAVLDGLKVRAANLARPVKKSELLRAGIAALNAMSDKAFLAAINGVPSLKTGRPKKP